MLKKGKYVNYYPNIEQRRLSNIGCGQDDLAGISAWVGTTLERDIEAAMLNTELTLD
ncbi:uncharacterized protein ACHE_60332S [Aspergillus chevalieri]|uniref:Uncharacterized protein n=1 Tax=Aspergillus chevalieri TaxID=182096 RepID=A0A7R7VTD4_ASPCH|nr:uncharacterized protein ACHE_60332S [Aspergillus chevalieri]BCR90446.1 hypothetical protein ACHE_60332S [Aspergillus chevalieri]